jgi:sulfite exporter TauE/SafE
MTMKRKLTYVQKIRLALYFDIGQVITLLIVGCGLAALVAPIVFQENSLRIIAALICGVLALLIGLPMSCNRRLDAIDKDFGEGVADAFVEWRQTAQKGDVADLEAMAEKVKSEKK